MMMRDVVVVAAADVTDAGRPRRPFSYTPLTGIVHPKNLSEKMNKIRLGIYLAGLQWPLP